MVKNVKTGYQNAALQNIILTKPVKVIAVSAGKGGVGKSTVALNLSVALAELNKKVLLLDADLGLANLDTMLNLNARHNLSHVIHGVCSLKEIMVDGPKGIKVIPAASGADYMTGLSPTQHAGIIDSFNELEESFDYMIIDTAAGISDTVLSFTRSSQEVLLVVCDEPTSLTDAYALIKIMNKRFEWSYFHILANMIRNAREGREVFNRLYRVADQFLDVRLDFMGSIPFDEKVHDAVKKQTVVLTAYPGCPAAKAFRQAAQKVDSWPCHRTLGGNTSFFLERLVANIDKRFSQL